MPYEQVAPISMSLTANGGADGYLTVTANTGVYPGAVGWLSNSTPLNQRVKVTDLSGTTKIGIRFIAEGNDDPKLRDGTVQRHSQGRSDCSAFTTALSSKLSLEQCVVKVQQPIFDPAVNGNP